MYKTNFWFPFYPLDYYTKTCMEWIGTQTGNKLLNFLYLENIFEILHQQIWLSVNIVGFPGSVQILLIFNIHSKMQ